MKQGSLCEPHMADMAGARCGMPHVHSATLACLLAIQHASTEPLDLHFPVQQSMSSCQQQ